MLGCEGDDLSAPVVRIEGVDPKGAVGVADQPKSIYLGPVYAHANDADLPPTVAHILLGPSCTETAPFVVEGELSTSDLRDRFQFQVTKTDPPGLRYTGLLLDIRLDSSTEGVNLQRGFSDLDQFRVEIGCVRAKLPTLSFRANRVTFLANGPYCGKNGLPCHDPETGEPIRG
jgi:hypothetical protein